jgi:hypothetical protein
MIIPGQAMLVSEYIYEDGVPADPDSITAVLYRIVAGSRDASGVTVTPATTANAGERTFSWTNDAGWARTDELELVAIPVFDGQPYPGVIWRSHGDVDAVMRGTELAALASNYNATRAGYLDKLAVSGTLAHSDDAATYKATGFAVAGDAMTLTSGEREATAVVVESHLLDEGDSQMLINAIVGAIGNTNIDQAILIAAIRADLERSGGNLNTLIARIAGTIRTAADDVTAETAQTADVRSGLALEATAQSIKGKTDGLTFTVENQADVNVKSYNGTPQSNGDLPLKIDAVKSVVDSIVSKTDNLPASPAATSDVQVTVTPDITVNPTELSNDSVNAIRSGLATGTNVTDATTTITTAIGTKPSADAIATRLLSNPANKLLTNGDGHVTATNGGAVVSPEAQSVTFTALIDEDTDQPVSGVSIRIAGRELTTLTDGSRSIDLDPSDEPYIATIIVPTGYQEIDDIEVTVDDEPVTVSLDLVPLATATPATAPQTNVQLPTEDQYGNRKANVTVKFTFLSHAEGATITGTIVNTPAPKTSDSDGICRVVLRRLANYRAEYTIPGDRTPKTVLFTTGNTGADTIIDD